MVENSYDSENFAGLAKSLAFAEARLLQICHFCLQGVRETEVLMRARHPGYDVMVALKRKEEKERMPAMRNNCSRISRTTIRQQSSVRPDNRRILVDVTTT